MATNANTPGGQQARRQRDLEEHDGGCRRRRSASRTARAISVSLASRRGRCGTRKSVAAPVAARSTTRAATAMREAARPEVAERGAGARRRRGRRARLAIAAREHGQRDDERAALRSSHDDAGAVRDQANAMPPSAAPSMAASAHDADDLLLFARLERNPSRAPEQHAAARRGGFADDVHHRGARHARGRRERGGDDGDRGADHAIVSTRAGGLRDSSRASRGGERDPRWRPRRTAAQPLRIGARKVQGVGAGLDDRDAADEDHVPQRRRGARAAR